jgi:quercetin dioxygenase-like cupin family protein
MQIERNGRGSVARPPEAGFTGDVRIIGYFRREAPSKLAGATVAFGAGSRTPWKTNPLGQTIIVISGVGRVQSEGGPIEEIHAGDIIWWSPGERHWEGAAPDEPMSYVAVQEEDFGGVTFGDAVTDAQYGGDVRQ